MRAFTKQFFCAVLAYLLVLGLIPGFSFYRATPPAIASTEELPKVSAADPTWYLLVNQPRVALMQDVHTTDIRLRIASTDAMVDSSSYLLEAAPYIKNGRTMVPVRFITEGLGATVAWEATEKKVSISYEGTGLDLWIGKDYATVDGVRSTLEAAPEIKSSRTFVPIRFIAENFRASVGWNADIKEVSIRKETQGDWRINESSDADGDGLTFAAEKVLGTNPNSKNTIYAALDDKAVADVVKQYPGVDIFAAKPDGVCSVTLPAKVALSLDPRTPFNIDSVVDDEFALRYALAHGVAGTKETAMKEIAGIVSTFGEKLGNGVELAMGTRILLPEKADAAAEAAQTQVESSYAVRAYKEGTTLDALTSSERYKALMLLNNAFGEQEINLLLSQSTTLQKGDVTKYSDLVKTLQDASNATETSLGKKVKETNTFRQYVNQLGLNDYNAGELAVKMWDGASAELKEQIKTHPKWALSIVSGFAPFVSGKDAQNSEILDLVVNYAKEHFSYHVETEKILNDLADKENDADLRRPLEGFDWMTLQFLLPNQSWTNAENVEKLPDLKSKLENTLNYVNDLRVIRDNAVKYHHDVKVTAHPEITLDLLSNLSGPGSINYEIGIYDPLNKGHGTAWGEKYVKENSEMGWPATTDSEIAEKIAYLFAKGTVKIEDNEKIQSELLKGEAQISRIVSLALNFPTMEVRNRGPASTMKEDNGNLIYAYAFDKAGSFWSVDNLTAYRLEGYTGPKYSGGDYLEKIRLNYVANPEKPFNVDSNYIKYNVKGLLFDDAFSIKQFEEILNN